MLMTSIFRPGIFCIHIFRILGTVLLLSLAACSKTPTPVAVQAVNTEGLALITTAPSKSASISERIGVVEATQQATLSAQTAGRVNALLVDVGDLVKAKQILARLSEVEQLAEQNRAQAMVNATQAAATEAEAEFKRMRNLQREHVVSAQQLEQALARRDSAHAQLASAQAGLRDATQHISYTVIRAPFDGVISARHVQLGESVVSGTALMSMNAPDQLRLRVSLAQAEALALDATQTAQILLDNGKTITATGMVIFPNSDAQTHTVAVRMQLPAALGLQPGMTLRVLLASRAQPDALASAAPPEIVIPASAVVQRSEVSGVYIVSKQTIVLRQVRLGHRVGTAQVEVLSGLTAGETIAADPLAASLRLAQRL